MRKHPWQPGPFSQFQCDICGKHAMHSIHARPVIDIGLLVLLAITVFVVFLVNFS